MRFKALSVALAAVLVVGCTEQATSPTALNDAAVAPTFNFINGPAMPGNSGIVRFELQEVYIGADPKDEVFSVIGLTVPLNESFFCGFGDFPDNVEFLTWQEWFAGDAYHQHVQGKDLTVEILDFEWDCGDESIAVGTGDINVVDNDLFVSDTRANSFGYSAHGVLTDVATGARVNYSETFRGLIRKNSGFLVLVENIHLVYPGN